MNDFNEKEFEILLKSDERFLKIKDFVDTRKSLKHLKQRKKFYNIIITMKEKVHVDILEKLGYRHEPE